MFVGERTKNNKSKIVREVQFIKFKVTNQPNNKSPKHKNKTTPERQLPERLENDPEGSLNRKWQYNNGGE
jgi:hypothetical protein